MTDYTRYALYWTPPPGPFTDLAAAWLGWNPWTATEIPQAETTDPGISQSRLTEEPRRYGFHGTLKAPFRLAEGGDRAGLEEAARRFAAQQAPVRVEGLTLSRLSGFVALRPTGDVSDLNRFAMRVVEAFDSFRAPLTEAEIARRKPEVLSSAQRDKLAKWGYPYVGDDFRFHLTLTGKVPDDVAMQVMQLLEPRLAPLLPAPLLLEHICLFGQRPEGRFEVIASYPLEG